MTKPRMKPDVWNRQRGFVCRSFEPGGWKPGGSHVVTGSGDTMSEAFARWLKNRDDHPKRIDQPKP